MSLDHNKVAVARCVAILRACPCAATEADCQIGGIRQPPGLANGIVKASLRFRLSTGPSSQPDPGRDPPCPRRAAEACPPLPIKSPAAGRPSGRPRRNAGPGASWLAHRAARPHLASASGVDPQDPKRGPRLAFLSGCLFCRIPVSCPMVGRAGEIEDGGGGARCHGSGDAALSQLPGCLRFYRPSTASRATAGTTACPGPCPLDLTTRSSLDRDENRRATACGNNQKLESCIMRGSWLQVR